MKKIIMAMAAVIFALALTACTAVQVNERIFVALMGIEEDDGIYYLSVQAFNSTEVSQDGPIPEYAVYSGTGRSFNEAADMIMRDSGRELFWGHCGVIFADDDIIRDAEKLKAFAGERISVGCPVIYSENPAAETDRRDENDELIGADVIISSLDRYVAEGLYRETTLRDVISAGNVITLPLSDKGISGTAVITGSGGTMLLDLSETAAFDLLMGEKGVCMSVLGGSVCAEISDKNVYLKQDNTSGQYEITLTADLVLEETGSAAELAEYKTEAEKIISASAEAICQKAYDGGFLSAIFPREYSFSEGMDSVAFSVTTNVNIKM